MKKPLAAIDWIEIPDLSVGSERHSENLFSSAQLARTHCAAFAKANKKSPARAIQMPWVSIARACSLMPTIFSSNEATVRLYTSTLSESFSMAEASCCLRKSKVLSIDAMRFHASADRSPKRPRMIWTKATVSMIRKAKAHDHKPRAPNQMGPRIPATKLKVAVNRDCAPILANCFT